ncbi:TnsA endonuclease N-terminal domain-containing protein [Paenibacillus cookii]|uniref:TnsA endonuclease N-terminal domain-containing protein n=1 Tax=Paenibacillus cookii TaxID=157839 RepID=A0ABQ4M357_9BACL|nr:TnsA endonuclease N-terminal domain-containing protein [Paenibacillus cookii]GIO69980.1 hypothetical protein J21TS3_48010 [Paenibacillus cookii]
MAKRKRQFTEAKIERMIQEGRGQGSGKDYLPWLTIQDVPSEGRATRGVGWTTGRRHQLLSDIERDYFYLLDYCDDVTDIREQFPLLPLEETQMIAEKIGVEHPKDPKTGIPVVMTTDFLITYRDKTLARTVKPSAELENERTIVSRACLACDEQLGLDAGTSLALFRHFIARKIWSVDMTERIIPTLPAKDFSEKHSDIRLEAKGG